MISYDKFCSFFFFIIDYLVDNLKFYFLGNVIYIKDFFYKFISIIKLFK